LFLTKDCPNAPLHAPGGQEDRSMLQNLMLIINKYVDEITLRLFTRFRRAITCASFPCRGNGGNDTAGQKW
jgi:hypothetical protein